MLGLVLQQFRSWTLNLEGFDLFKIFNSEKRRSPGEDI